MKNLKDYKVQLLELFYDLSGYIKYGVLKQQDINPMPSNVQIETRKSSKDNTILALAPEYPGLFTVAKKEEDLVENVNDAIYTYFGVSRYVAKRIGNTFLPSDGPLQSTKKSPLIQFYRQPAIA